jgi:hypothetical protein
MGLKAWIAELVGGQTYCRGESILSDNPFKIQAPPASGYSKNFLLRVSMRPRHGHVNYSVQSIMDTFSSNKDYEKYTHMYHRLAKA